QDDSKDKDVDVTVVDSLKDISKTLKEKFILLGDKIREKVDELKQAAGDHAQKVKAQLKNLKMQLKESVQALKKKIQGFFKNGQYASWGDHAIQVFGKMVELRDRLTRFAEGLKNITVNNLKKMQEGAKQLRKEIKMKVQELLHGSSDYQTALYHASDDDNDDEEENKAYVIETLKDISKTLKEKWLVLVERLKQKFAELKQVGREQAGKVKEQIQVLKKNVANARDDLKKKVQEVFKPAQYASFGEHAMEIFGKLLNLREKLNKFLESVTTVTGEKLDKLRDLIKETRQAIKERVQELLGLRSDTPALYHASDDDEEEEDNDVYVIATLKDISKSLKEKFLILVDHLKQKFAEMKEVGGQHAEKIKAQIQVLKEKVADAREGLVQKVQELLKPGQYASFGEHAMEVFAKLGKLREKLTYFLEQVKNVANEKLDKIQELIGSRSDETALYQASDAEEDHEAYIIDTLRDISKTLKEKFQVLGQRIRQKVEELKEAAGQRVAVLKKQLQELTGQLGEAAGAMKKKVQEIVQPGQLAQYGYFDDVSSAVSEKLVTLRNKLQRFLRNVQQLAGEKLAKMQEAIRELRNEIKRIIQTLLRG
ncbi:unnamed protein product, partial [Ixodes hexagonus]